MLSEVVVVVILAICLCGVSAEADVPINAQQIISSPTAELEEAQAAELENAANNIQVSRYLGLGYNIFRGNPLSIHLDPGLKRNSFKPVKILRAISKPNSTCPDLTQCLQSHVPEILDSVHYVQTIQDYQNDLLSQLRLYGRVTSNISAAFGVLDKSFWTVSEQLAKGQYFVDHIRLSVSQEADLDYRHSQSLHPSFVTALCELPEDYHVDEYASFLLEFGTHVVVTVREALIEVNRTVIDKKFLRQALQDAGKSPLEFADGFFPSNITKNVLSRAVEIMSNLNLFPNYTTQYSSSSEIPLVTGLRELGYFVTRDRISSGNPWSASCQTFLGQWTNDEIDSRLQSIRENLEQALVSYANRTAAKAPKLAEDFVRWEAPLSSDEKPAEVHFRATTEKSLVVHPEDNELCADALSLLGLGYDLFHGDLYSSGRDSGLHSHPPILRKSNCIAQGLNRCPDAMSCSTVTPPISTEHTSYVWRIEDFTEQLRKGYEILGSLPDALGARLSCRSSSRTAAQRILDDGRTFRDSVTTTIAAEASATYRAMDKLDPNFVHALCELPAIYNSTAYAQILQEFGTHVITKVQMGNFSIDRITVPHATVVSEALKSANSLAEFEPISTEHQLSTRQIHAATDRAVEKARILKQDSTTVRRKIATPVRLTLRELSYFVTKDRIAAASLGAVCRHIDETAVASIKSGLNQAMQQYATDPVPPLPPIQPTTPPLLVTPAQPRPIVMADPAGVWPSGTYGLLEPSTGCPSGGGWSRGSRFHDSEDHLNRNRWNWGFDQLTTSRFSTEGITLKFCVKSSPSSLLDLPAPEWPAGAYCLFKKKTCPKGFHTSFVHHDDEDTNNRNTVRGVLPDGFYNHDTRYYFCCRSDGATEDSIQLPVEKPFFLLREGPRCQTIEGMQSMEMWLFMDCEDRVGGGCRVSPGYGDSHPGVRTRDGDWEYAFCYYEPQLHISPLAVFMRDIFSETDLEFL